MDRYQDEGGPSARHLVLMFLAAVAVCAVFFSLGFVVGYNHSSSRVTPVTENVTASGNIPPTVNPPAGGTSQPSSQALETESVSPGSASIPKPERPQPSPSAAAAASQPQTRRPTERSVRQGRPIHNPARAMRRAAVSSSTTSNSHFAVQVMASRTRKDAEHLVEVLKSHGYRVYILTPQQAHAKDKFYRVQVGPFPSRVEADRTRDKLVSEGFRPFVVHR